MFQYESRPSNRGLHWNGATVSKERGNTSFFPLTSLYFDEKCTYSPDTLQICAIYCHMFICVFLRPSVHRGVTKSSMWKKFQFFFFCNSKFDCSIYNFQKIQHSSAGEMKIAINKNLFDLVLTKWILSKRKPSSLRFLDNMKINHIATTLLTIEKTFIIPFCGSSNRTCKYTNTRSAKKRQINSNIDFCIVS